MTVAMFLYRKARQVAIAGLLIAAGASLPSESGAKLAAG